MTRKDFELIAAVLLSERPEIAPGVRYQWATRHEQGLIDEWSTVCLNFRAKLKGLNPQFKGGKFLTACGYPHPSLR